MVTSVTSFGRSGLSDWLLQRVSAVVLLAYFIFIAFTLAGGIDYVGWKAVFGQTWVRIFSLLAILSLATHAWIGMWTIGTDYIREHYFGQNANGYRLIYQVICILTLASYLFWGVKILWGN